MNNITESLFRAVEVITDKKIEEIKFDKTIECIVVNDSKAKEGEYQVQYQDILLTAYSNNNTVLYSNEDNVYVLIPQSNFSLKKTIVGKVQKKGEEFIDFKSIVEQVQKIGENYVTSNGKFRIDNVNFDRIEIPFNNEDFIKDYPNKVNILLGANITNKLSSISGDYGFAIEVLYKNGLQHTYKMNITSMVGNPYQLEGQYQYRVLPLVPEEVDKIISVYIYSNDFQENEIDYIEFTNLEIVYVKAKEAEGLEQFTADIICEKGDTFKNGLLNPDAVLPMFMKLYKVSKPLNNINATYKWFYMDSKVNKPNTDLGWDSDGGLGWHIIPENNNLGLKYTNNGATLEVSAKFIENLEVFKCVAIFGGETINYPDGSKQSFGVVKVEAIQQLVDNTDSFLITINSSLGDVFKEGQAGEVNTILTCNVRTGTETLDPNMFLYSWSKVSDSGVVEEIVAQSPNNTIVVNMQNDVTDVNNYICEVFKKE